MGVVVFEDEGWRQFGPVALMRHVSQLRRGTKTLLSALAEAAPGETSLWGREELKEVTEEAVEAPYNEPADGETLFVNARARPGKELNVLLSRAGNFAAFSGTVMVAARASGGKVPPGVLNSRTSAGMGKALRKVGAPAGSLFKGYWELVESNGLAIAEQALHFEDAVELQDRVRVIGPPSNLRVHGSAEVEDYVVFDVRAGPVVVSAGASVESFSRISGPCFIGAKTKVASALIRGGTSVFQGCRVGGEVDNSIIMPHTNKAHLGYVGDSLVGEWVNLGASSTFSNLKNTYGTVRVDLGAGKTETSLVKLGPVIGDMSKVSIGALVSAGRAVGVGSHVTGTASVNVPAFTYFNGAGGSVELLVESVVETQRRMIERRGMTLGKSEERLIRWAFKATARERRAAGVRRGKLS